VVYFCIELVEDKIFVKIERALDHGCSHFIKGANADWLFFCLLFKLFDDWLTLENAPFDIVNLFHPIYFASL